MPGRLSAYAFILSGAVVFAVASALAGAQSQMRPAPPAESKPLAVALPKPAADASFAAFRNELADIASRKDRAALARLVAANFFWMSGRGDRASKKKPAIDNLAKAIDLDDADGSGWETLARMTRAATLVPAPGRRGVMCAPLAKGGEQLCYVKDNGWKIAGLADRE